MQTQQLLPLRGTTIAEILENDHRIVRGLLDSLCQEKDRATRMQTLERIKAALTIHNAMEENLIYPALDKIAGHMLETQKLYHETASADIVIFQLDTMLKTGEDAEFQSKAEKLRDMILKHVETEEHKALPHLKEGANQREYQLLLESVRKFRDEVHYDQH